MAVIISRAEQSYAPDTYTITRTIPQGAVVNRIKITLTDPGTWPAGRAVVVRLIGPNGPSGGATFDGGIVLDRNGVPRTVRTAEFAQYSGNPDGSTSVMPFPVGDYTLEFDALPDLLPGSPLRVTTAATVERF